MIMAKKHRVAITKTGKGLARPVQKSQVIDHIRYLWHKSASNGADETAPPFFHIFESDDYLNTGSSIHECDSWCL